MTSGSKEVFFSSIPNRRSCSLKHVGVFIFDAGHSKLRRSHTNKFTCKFYTKARKNYDVNDDHKTFSLFYKKAPLKFKLINKNV